MSVSEILFGYLLDSIFCYWIVFLGGVKKIEGWLSIFTVGWVAWDWNSEQIKVYCFVGWVLQTVIGGIWLLMLLGK